MPEYVNGIRVRVIPPGVFGSDFSLKPGKLGMRSWGKPPEGYESVKDAARRLEVAVRDIYRLCLKNRLEHIVVGRDKSKRVYVRKLSIPTRDGE